MKTTNWNQIETALRQVDTPRPQVEHDEFWAEFRARAELTGQDHSTDVLMLQPRVWGSALGVAAALAMLLGISFLLLRPHPAGMTAYGTAITTVTYRDPNVGISIDATDDHVGTIVYVTDYSSMPDDGPTYLPAPTPLPEFGE